MHFDVNLIKIGKKTKVVPYRPMTLLQRRINVDITSCHLCNVASTSVQSDDVNATSHLRCTDVDSTLPWRRVPTGLKIMVIKSLLRAPP